MANLSKTKLADLRKLAKEAEVEGYEDMERAELVAALEEKQTGSGEEAPAEKEEEIKAPEDVSEAPVSAIGVDESVAPVGSKAAKMKEILSKQPKVRVLIPLEPGEKRGSTESVTLNGYRLNIQKGVYVDVPQQVADVLSNSLNQTIEALEGSGLKLNGNESALS